MTLLRRLVLAMVSLVLLGCATPNVRRDRAFPLAPGEAYISMMVRVHNTDYSLVLEPKDVPGRKFFFENWYAFGPFLKEFNFILAKVPAGTYTVSYLHRAPLSYYFDEEPIVIEPNRINYLGLIEIDGLPGTVGEPCRYRYTSDFTHWTSVLESRYPILSEKYEQVDLGPGDNQNWRYMEGHLMGKPSARDTINH